MLPSLSIIIPTKNRPSDLKLTVESVLRQSVRPTELIIVDQSQSDESKRQVERLYAEAPPLVRETIRLSYIWDAGISGLPFARNRGMEITQGDIRLFLDDDVVLEPNFLEELLTVYEQHPYVSGVSGIITNYRRPSWAYRLWASMFVRGPFHDERQPIYWKADRLREAEPIRVTKFTGALMSFRADAIQGHRFHGGILDGEEVDFCRRLGSDAVLLIAPRARLVHRTSPIGRSQGHWLRGSGQSSYYLYHRNWRTGFRNFVSFAWLNLGLGLAALLASARRGSLAPWRALRDGAREGARVTGVATASPARFGWRL